jgi:hypothetical protein
MSIVIWTPKHDWNADAERPGEVRVTTKPFDRTRGDRWMPVKTEPEASDEFLIAMTFIHFHTMVVRDGIDPQVAHKELLKIDEYRKATSPEIDGAES